LAICGQALSKQDNFNFQKVTESKKELPFVIQVRERNRKLLCHETRDFHLYQTASDRKSNIFTPGASEARSPPSDFTLLEDSIMDSNIPLNDTFARDGDFMSTGGGHLEGT